jgi:mannose-1-phosphate guanylyltransferase
MVTMAGEDLWALVLAGGDGTRLQALTRLISGAPIPKQYCRIVGEQSLLEATLARVGRVVPRERTLVVVNQNHLDVARAQVAALPRRNVLIQPCNRDTGPGLALALLALEQRHPGAALAVFPSDHFVHSQPAFAASVERMQHVLAVEPRKIVLLGIRPDRPDPGLGYIVPEAGPPHLDRLGSYRVRGFEEKPSPSRAAAIVRDGALWSSFILLFRVGRMLEILRLSRPREMAALEDVIGDRVGCSARYRDLGAWNFSHEVLARHPQDLLVVPADDLGWSDWGTPEAITQTISALGLTAGWLRAPLVESRAAS